MIHHRFFTVLLLASASAFGQPGPAQLPPSILPPDAKVERLQDGFRFTEGPALAPDGRIFFTDIPNNRIHVYDPSTATISIHREQSGAANGLMFEKSGALLACEGGNRRVTRQLGSALPETVADTVDGKKFNSPNDLDIDARGGIYFTDPRYGKTDDLELPGEYVFYIPPGSGTAPITRVVDHLKKPNGIALSPDGKVLYVADNGDGSLHAFDVNAADGTLANGRLLSAEAPRCDGLCVDTTGNLYVTTKEGVKVFSPTGAPLGVIAVPETPANCCFGARGTKLLYITARTGFYRIQLAVDGLK